jgi:5'-methylthioadenosine phosphorylase
MAEGFARRLLPPDVAVHSAGTEPRTLDPRAVRVMAELGVDIGAQRAKAIGEVPLAEIDRVITLCDDAAERCPRVPDARRDHWPLPDPQSDAELRAVQGEILEDVLALADELAPEPAIGVIGGSGFYELPGVTAAAPCTVDTPFGAPSDALTVGQLGERRVVFLARHGREHGLLPGEVNARANVYALKRLGVTTVVSVSAVGSLREEIEPGDVVLPHQFIDRTVGRPSTFFGQGVVAHASLADPTCRRTAGTLGAAARAEGFRVHDQGTYACIEGPQFGTRAESAMLRSWGADLVGMTNLPEARLAREAEICYATLALPTDYDSWRERTDAVRVSDVVGVLRANVDKARRVLARALAALDPAAPCACRRALDTALFTPPERIGPAARVRLGAVLARVLKGALR